MHKINKERKKLLGAIRIVELFLLDRLVSFFWGGKGGFWVLALILDA